MYLKFVKVKQNPTFIENKGRISAVLSLTKLY